jgi:hypothetical protein
VSMIVFLEDTPCVEEADTAKKCTEGTDEYKGGSFVEFLIIFGDRYGDRYGDCFGQHFLVRLRHR